MTRTSLRLATLAWLAWLVCFMVLARLGTWTPFAFVGLALAVASVSLNAVPRAAFRPTLRSAALGLGAGMTMVLLTHWAFAGVERLLPRVRPATQELLWLLNVVSFSPTARAGLIVVIAACEEVLFRGLLPFAGADAASRAHVPSRRELVQLLGFTGLYALTTSPLGSPLLVLCALICGTAWGLMRLLTGSLLVPLLAHVVWDLGVLLLWPITSHALS